ncbi:putative reverse transcriptase domain-containing protein [Tanacetum coccineum]|uniref:Reverse transcriptase domain-containing protein n=1 Tax=Tanacetum coccineum TaxID=301880 RepID=A0ABQ5A4U2_9ASTR
MTKLTQKKVTFEWGDRQEAAFQLIKQKLCSAPIMALPEGSEDFIMILSYYYVLWSGRFASTFWRSLQKALGTNLDMSTAYHLQTGGQSEETIKNYQGYIKQRIQAVRDRQKSYADLKCKPMEFQVGDRVMLKVSPWKGVVKFLGKRGSLITVARYVGHFKVLEKVRVVAYKVELPQELSRVHNTFHVSNLKKCCADEQLVVPLDGLHIDDKLHFVEEPIEIMDHEVKQLKQIRIPIVKVRWNSRRDFVMSDSEDSTVTYTEVSSPFEDLSDIGSPGVDGLPMMLEDPYVEAALQAPPSPDYVPGPEHPPSPVYVPYVPEPVYPEFMPPEDDVLPAEEQPLPAAVSPTADSPGYITESDPEEDPEEDDEDPEEDPADYPTDKDDGEEEEEESCRDDVDDEDEDEDEDEEAEEEHLAPTDSVPPPACHTISTTIVSSPLHVSPPPLPASPTYPLGYRADIIRLRAESPSTSHPLPPPSPIVLPYTKASVDMMRAAM